MSEFFQAGGVAMYPVLLFGFLSVASAVLSLLRPERRLLPLVATLGLTTAACGLLGSAVGIMVVFRYAPQAEAAVRPTVMALGVAESLTVVILALGLLVVTGLVAALGAWRASSMPAPAAALR